MNLDSITPNIIASVVSALIIFLAIAMFRATMQSFRKYMEATIAPKGGKNLHDEIIEARDLSARAVVIATQAEASAKRCEGKLDALILASGRTPVV